VLGFRLDIVKQGQSLCRLSATAFSLCQAYDRWRSPENVGTRDAESFVILTRYLEKKTKKTQQTKKQKPKKNKKNPTSFPTSCAVKLFRVSYTEL
jgi:hypothetical protein